MTRASRAAMRDVIRRCDVVVVGGGISGQACAASAAARGADVVLVEKERGPAVEASGRAQGSIRLQGREAAEFPLANEAIALWQEIDEREELELSFDGNIYLCDDASELPMLERLVAGAAASGLHDVELLDPAAARERLPAATGPFAAAMWSPHDGQCHPQKATQYFARKARDAGVVHLYGTKALGIAEEQGRVRGLETDRGAIAASAVVIAGGVWTPHLARTVGVRIPIMPVVVSQAETDPAAVRLLPTIRAFAFGCRQRPDGRIVLSGGLNSIVEHRLTLAALSDMPLWAPRFASNRRNVRLRLDFPTTLGQLRRRSAFSAGLIPVDKEPPRPNRPHLEGALRAMRALVPAIGDVRIRRAWTGMIDISPDGLPILDHEPGPEGLAFVAGLSGHGLALGPVIGEITADLALEQRTERPIEPFRLARFREAHVPAPAKMI